MDRLDYHTRHQHDHVS